MESDIGPVYFIELRVGTSTFAPQVSRLMCQEIKHGVRYFHCADCACHRKTHCSLSTMPTKQSGLALDICCLVHVKYSHDVCIIFSMIVLG